VEKVFRNFAKLNKGWKLEKMEPKKLEKDGVT
jgi:hypothetical protein